MNKSADRPNEFGEILLALICMIIGGYALLRYLIAAIFNPWFLYGPIWFGMDQPPGLAEVDAVAKQLWGWVMLSTLSASALGLILLVFGIALCVNARWAWKVGVIWSILKLVQSVLAASLSLMLVRAPVNGLPNPNTTMYGPDELWVQGAIGAAIALAWHLSLPLVVLISRPYVGQNQKM